MNLWMQNERMRKRHQGEGCGWKDEGVEMKEGRRMDARTRERTQMGSTWPKGSRALRGEVEALRTEEGEVVGSAGGCWDRVEGRRKRERERASERREEEEGHNRVKKEKESGSLSNKSKSTTACVCVPVYIRHIHFIKHHCKHCTAHFVCSLEERKPYGTILGSKWPNLSFLVELSL